MSFGAFSDKEIWFILNDFVMRKYWKATPSTQLNGLGERCEPVTSKWGLAWGKDLAANDFSDIWVENQQNLTSGPRPGKSLDPPVTFSCEFVSIIHCRACVYSISLLQILICFLVKLADVLQLRITNTIRISEFKQPNTACSLVPY